MSTNEMEYRVRRLGVLTSGGDAPGMNAAIRAVVRTALNMGIECVGIHRGRNGFISGDCVQTHSNMGRHAGFLERALPMTKHLQMERHAVLEAMHNHA